MTALLLAKHCQIGIGRDYEDYRQTNCGRGQHEGNAPVFASPLGLQSYIYLLLYELALELNEGCAALETCLAEVATSTLPALPLPINESLKPCSCQG